MSSSAGDAMRRLGNAMTTSEPQSADQIWEIVQLARHQDRPYPLDYIPRLLSDFEELRGDRLYRDDPAIVAGIGRYHDEPVILIGQQKGRDTQERTYRNFGMPAPEGYRKAMRVMALAEKIGAPVVTLIDTPGAFPGADAEQRGQGGAIATSMRTMLRLSVPTIAIVIGEGSSGGAIALGVADRVMMLQNATYSVISPEGGSAILWRDAAQSQLAAAAFQPTAANCYRWGVVDAVIPEPDGGAHRDHDAAAQLLDRYLQRAIGELRDVPSQERRRQRNVRFRRIGSYRELALADASAVVSGRSEESR
jgi:acetyl-CoA carboxylase carboxyl transferase subunit alpha